MHQSDLGEQAVHAGPPTGVETPDTCSAGGPPATELHDVATLFPPMREREFEALVADIREHGLREPIWTHQGKVIDGRHRLMACQRLGISPQFREWSGEGSLLEFVIALNLHRRHLKETQRAMIAARMLPKFEEEAKKRQLAGIEGNLRNHGYEGQNDTATKSSRDGRASDDAGKLLNVSWMSVNRARKVLDKGCPALIDAVDHCKLAVRAAAELAERSHEEQQDLLAQGRKAIAEALRPLPAVDENAGQTGRDEGGAAATMPQAPPPDMESAKHSPIIEQRIADEWLLNNFHAGNAKLTKDEWGFRLEFSGDHIDDWRAAMRDPEQLLRMIMRGFRVVWKR